MVYVNVAVSIPTNPQWQAFTYSVPLKWQSQIKAGQYLLVPWGQKLIYGVALTLTTQSPVAKVKPIKEIVLPQPILKTHQLKLLEWLSYYYASSYNDCLNLFLPPLPKNLNQVESLKDNRQVAQRLILVPNFNQIPQAVAKITSKTTYLITHHRLPKTTKWQSWQKIYKGEVETIIGLRSAVFSPFTSLKSILMINEHDPAYKDERAPYYHAFTVALKLAGLTNAHLTIEDATPRVATYYFAKIPKMKNKITLKMVLPTQLPNYLIVDLNKERQLGNRSLISQALNQYLLHIYKRQLGPVLLYLNRKSEAGVTYCRTCQGSTLTEKEPETCPRCQSPHIFFSSTNLSKLAQEIAALIGEANYQLIKEGQVQAVPTKPVVLATSAIFSQPVIDKFTLIAVISADTSLNLADFTSSEETFQFLANLLLLPIKKLPHLPQVVVQTYNPFLKLFKYALTFNYPKFYHEELVQRKLLLYPPFSTLAKLTISAKNESKAQKLAEDLYQQLQQIEFDGEITGPVSSLKPLSPKPKWHIILKAENRSKLDPVLAQVPKNWTINIDPRNLL